MAVPRFLKTFLDTAKTIATAPSKKTVSGPPGSGQIRVKEGEITKRKEVSAGIFGSKPFLTRPVFRRQLKKISGKIPGGGVYTRKERVAIEKELFPREKFGAYITPYEMSRRIKKLKHNLFQSRNLSEKIAIRKQIKFLEKLRGKEENDR